MSLDYNDSLRGRTLSSKYEGKKSQGRSADQTNSFYQRCAGEDALRTASAKTLPEFSEYNMVTLGKILFFLPKYQTAKMVVNSSLTLWVSVSQPEWVTTLVKQEVSNTKKIKTGYTTTLFVERIFYLIISVVIIFWWIKNTFQFQW